MQDLILVPLGQVTESRCENEVYNTIKESFYVLKLSNRGLEIYHEVFAFRFSLLPRKSFNRRLPRHEDGHSMIHDRIVHVVI